MGVGAGARGGFPFEQISPADTGPVERAHNGIAGEPGSMRQKSDVHYSADQLVVGSAPTVNGASQTAGPAIEERSDGGDGDGQSDHQAPDAGRGGDQPAEQ